MIYRLFPLTNMNMGGSRPWRRWCWWLRRLRWSVGEGGSCFASIYDPKTMKFNIGVCASELEHHRKFAWKIQYPHSLSHTQTCMYIWRDTLNNLRTEEWRCVRVLEAVAAVDAAEELVGKAHISAHTTHSLLIHHCWTPSVIICQENHSKDWIRSVEKKVGRNLEGYEENSYGPGSSPSPCAHLIYTDKFIISPYYINEFSNYTTEYLK